MESVNDDVRLEKKYLRTYELSFLFWYNHVSNDGIYDGSNLADRRDKVIITCEIDDDCNLSENRGWGDVSVPHGGGSHYQEPEQVFRCVQAMLYWSVIESKGWRSRCNRMENRV